MGTTVRGEQIRDGTILNADIGAAAAIDWTKISKAGSSLADLITRSAGDLDAGTLLDARLSANVPLKDAENIFTAKQRINHGLGVNRDSASPGEIKASGGIWEHNRVAAIGEGTAVAFNAGDFTGSGAMTWTLAAGDVQTFDWWLVGDIMFVDMVFNTSSVGGTPGVALSVLIPNGMTAVKTKAVPATLFDNTPVNFEFGLARVLASGTTIDFLRAASANWSLSTDLTYVRASLWFGVTL